MSADAAQREHAQGARALAAVLAVHRCLLGLQRRPGRASASATATSNVATGAAASAAARIDATFRAAAASVAGRVVAEEADTEQLKVASAPRERCKELPGPGGRRDRRRS